MAVAKINVAHHPQHYQLQTLGTETLGPVTLGTQASTVISAGFLLPCNYKIVKVGVFYTATDAVGGGNSFNLVVGTTGAYTQGNVPGNDNSFAQTFQPGPTQTSAAYPSPAPSYGLGYPTNIALAGQSVFLADVPINSGAAYAYTNPVAPFIAPSTGAPNVAYVPSGFGWVSATTTGGYGIFLPANYDAVYPGNIPLTLRATVVTSLANFTATLLIEPMYTRPTLPGPDIAAFPGIDF